MGDVRYERVYEDLRDAGDRQGAIAALRDEQIVEALTAAALAGDAFLANVLATEATNRIRHLRAALAHLGEGVLAVGVDGTVNWMNPAAERILGIGWRDATGRPFVELIDHRGEDRAPVADAIVAAALRGEARKGDGEWFRIDGREVCVTYTSAPIRGPEGDPQGAVVAFQDCAARKEGERKLRESHGRYKTLFDRLDVGIVSVAVDGRVLDVNPAAERITARPLAESRDQPWGETVHPADMPVVMRIFGEVVQGRESEARIRLRHRNGHYVTVDAKGIPIVIDGEVVGLHGLLRVVDRE